MYLSVLASDDSKDQKDDTAASSTELVKNLFKQPDKNQVTVIIDEELEFVAQNYLTDGIGTQFDKFELLGIAEFCTVSGSKLTILPTHNTPKGAYLFVLRVFDGQDRPQQQQFTINVVNPEDKTK